MTKEERIAKVRELIEAPSCCPEAKAAGQAYLDAVGTDSEAESAAALIAELEEDVCDIGGFIGFLSSEYGKQFFGEEAAAASLVRAKSAREAGVKYCLCPACTAGGAILDDRESFLP